MRKKFILIVLLFFLILGIVIYIRNEKSDLYVEKQIEKYNEEIEVLNNEERFLSDEEVQEILKNTNKTLLLQLDYDFDRKYFDFEKEEFPPESSGSGHMWSFGSNFKQETNNKVTIINKGIVYVSKEKYDRVPIKFSPKAIMLYDLMIEHSSTEIIACLLQTSKQMKEKIKYFGEEDVGNMKTSIVGGSCKFGGTIRNVKLWIWEETGIAIKSEIIEKASDTNNYSEPLRMLYEFKNIKFNEFDKDMFQIQEQEIYNDNETKSKESASENYIDSDGDGLIDFVETDVFNTDSRNIDTDGDGYSDSDEIEGAYNPNGEGRMLGSLYEIINN